MLKLFQLVVWVLTIWASVHVQNEVHGDIDLFAIFLLGGLCAYWATGLLILLRIGAASAASGLARACRFLFLPKHPKQPARIERRSRG